MLTLGTDLLYNETVAEGRAEGGLVWQVVFPQQDWAVPLTGFF